MVTLHRRLLECLKVTTRVHSHLARAVDLAQPQVQRVTGGVILCMHASGVEVLSVRLAARVEVLFCRTATPQPPSQRVVQPLKHVCTRRSLQMHMWLCRVLVHCAASLGGYPKLHDTRLSACCSEAILDGVRPMGCRDPALRTLICHVRRQLPFMIDRGRQPEGVDLSFVRGFLPMQGQHGWTSTAAALFTVRHAGAAA